MDIKAGTRLRCQTCGSEIVVVKAEAPALKCCGQELAAITAGRPA
jgi:hypothetical protein